MTVALQHDDCCGQAFIAVDANALGRAIWLYEQNLPGKAEPARGPGGKVRGVAHFGPQQMRSKM